MGKPPTTLNLLRVDDVRFDDLPEHADFMPTRPGPCFANGDVELAFGPNGLESVRAWVVNTTSMQCDTVWHITEAGQWPETCIGGEIDGGCSTAMATIVHLTHSSGEGTVARQIDALRWVYAWRVDDEHVAVAEATYNVPHPERTGPDIELMRTVCEGFVCGPEVAGRPRFAATPSKPAMATSPGGVDGATTPCLAPFTATVPESAFSSLSADRPPRQSALEQPVYRAAVVALMALYAVVALVLYLSHRHASALYGEALLFQSRAEIGMLAQLSDRLSGGDYGEVQSELQSFATRQHFKAAAVSNARGRVVAIVGDVPDVKIGDMPSELLAKTARVSALITPGTVLQGQLYTWGAPVLAASSGGTYTAAGVVICILFTGITLWWLRRRAESEDGLHGNDTSTAAHAFPRWRR